ncbi:lipase family protein [Jiulongibacter sediminis]|uniref:Phospholipase n=1 Tax=Jiulongibacter sediminis TaxID=1605367 RepID=A0A0P7BIL2_9BACT|nr:lipase family protein [Jiulongibacter sediminis]KPM46962.1 hypothetical protein AFM12_17170 [Jiulongibacter sediminis]TBX22308.1 hypothetical protein TK44_17175 [Jiulongibacter sediminis]
MMHKFRPFILLSLSWFFLISCEDKNIENQENVFLQESSLEAAYSLEEWKNFLTSSFGQNADQVLIFAQSGIEQYKITYLTEDLYGQQVLASGAVVVPTDISGAIALASIQHGTLFNEQDAPSYFNPGSESLMGSFFASTGILIGMPDYVGYGASKDSDHPYEHRQGLAKANADFIQAVREFMREKNLEWNNKLMLAGYSEGGYATMATHKYLQENLSNELPVTISICGAGAYDKTGSFDLLINEPSSGDIGHNRSYLWVLDTYNKAYNLNLNYSDIFKEPWASAIKAQGYITQIDTSLNAILTEQFINDYNNGLLTDLIDALADNDVDDWKANAQIRLYHGDADQYVPYSNSVSAEQKMKLKGSNIQLFTEEGGTHGSTIGSYIFGVLELFTVNKG